MFFDFIFIFVQFVKSPLFFKIVECEKGSEVNESMDDNESVTQSEASREPGQMEIVNYKKVEMENLDLYDSNQTIEPVHFVQYKDGVRVPVVSNILISIDQMDEHGNIIDSKIVDQESTELLPVLEDALIIKV